MAEKVKIEFEIDGISKGVSSIEDLQDALKGVESQGKKTEKTLEKTAEAAKDVGKAGEEAGKNAEAGTKIIDEAFGGLGTKIKEVGGGIKQLGSSAVTAFKSGVQGASAMSKALIATGIGAIVVALGLIAVYWDDIVGAISGVSSDQKKLLADTEATAQANQEALDAISASENSLKLSGKSEKEIRDLKIEQTNETIKAMEAQLTLQKEQSDAQVKALQRNKDIAQNVIRLLTAPITLLLAGVDALTAGLAKVGVLAEGTDLEKSFSGGIAGLIFDPEAAQTEADATADTITKNIDKLKNQRDGYILQGKAENQKAAQDRIQIEKDLNAELARLRAENLTDAEAKALELLRIQRDAERQALVDKKASAELLIEFDKQTAMQRQAVTDDFAAQAKVKQDTIDQEAADKKAIVDQALQQAGLDGLEDLFLKAQAELEIQRAADIEKITLAGATADQIAIINGTYTKKSKKLSEDEAKFKKALKKQEVNDALNTGAEVLDSIVGLVGEGSAVGKAAAVASATIQTYTSAQAAYASVVGTPFVGPALAPIAASIAVAGGIMNVKKILSTKTPGNKSSGGGGVPSVPTVPTFDPRAALAGTAEGQTQDNQITLGNQQTSSGATVIKAYVVSSDMSSQQEADKKINDLARL